MFGVNIYNGEDMFWKTKKQQHHLLALSSQNRNTDRTNSRWKDQSFPEYVVDVTRNSLLSFTTSLTKVSSHAHDYFARLSAILAFERMMRTCMGWMMPGFTSSPMAALGMAPMGFAMPSMWGLPDMLPSIPPIAQQLQPPRAPTWFGVDFLALPKPQPEPKPIPAPLASAAELSVYGAFFALPAAFLAIAPSMLQAWNLTA